MSPVCHSECDLTTDQRGVLRMNIMSRGSSTEWPYDCPIETHNGFSRDVDCLWSQPPPRVQVAASTSDLPLSETIAGSSVTIAGNVNAISVTNIDPCRDASILFVVTIRNTIEPVLDDGQTVRYVTRHRIQGDVDVEDTTFRQTWRDTAFARTTRIFGRTMTWNKSTLAPGATATVTLRLQGQMIGGSTGAGFLWTRAHTWMTALVTIP